MLTSLRICFLRMLASYKIAQKRAFFSHMARRSPRGPTPEDSYSPSIDSRRSPSVDARARGSADAGADWHAQQRRPGGRCMAGSLEDRQVECIEGPADQLVECLETGSTKGHFTLGSVNKGDLKIERALRDENILSLPCIVVFLQDTAPFDDNDFFARV